MPMVKAGGGRPLTAPEIMDFIFEHIQMFLQAVNDPGTVDLRMTWQRRELEDLPGDFVIQFYDFLDRLNYLRQDMYRWNYRPQQSVPPNSEPKPPEKPETLLPIKKAGRARVQSTSSSSSSVDMGSQGHPQRSVYETIHGNTNHPPQTHCPTPNLQQHDLLGLSDPLKQQNGPVLQNVPMLYNRATNDSIQHAGHMQQSLFHHNAYLEKELEQHQMNLEPTGQISQRGHSEPGCLQHNGHVGKTAFVPHKGQLDQNQTGFVSHKGQLDQNQAGFIPHKGQIEQTSFMQHEGQLDQNQTGFIPHKGQIEQTSFMQHEGQLDQTGFMQNKDQMDQAGFLQQKFQAEPTMLIHHKGQMEQAGFMQEKVVEQSGHWQRITGQEQNVQLQFKGHPEQNAQLQFKVHPEQNVQLQFKGHQEQNAPLQFKGHPEQNAQLQFKGHPEQNAQLQFKGHPEQNAQLQFKVHPEQNVQCHRYTSQPNGNVQQKANFEQSGNFQHMKAQMEQMNPWQRSTPQPNGNVEQKDNWEQTGNLERKNLERNDGLQQKFKTKKADGFHPKIQLEANEMSAQNLVEVADKSQRKRYPEKIENLQHRAYAEKNGNPELKSYLEKNENPQLKSYLEKNENIQHKSYLEKNENIQQKSYLEKNENPQLKSYLEKNENIQRKSYLEKNENFRHKSYLEKNENIQQKSYLEKKENIQHKGCSEAKDERQGHVTHAGHVHHQGNMEQNDPSQYKVQLGRIENLHRRGHLVQNENLHQAQSPSGNLVEAQSNRLSQAHVEPNGNFSQALLQSNGNVHQLHGKQRDLQHKGHLGQHHSSQYPGHSEKQGHHWQYKSYLQQKERPTLPLSNENLHVEHHVISPRKSNVEKAESIQRPIHVDQPSPWQLKTHLEKTGYSHYKVLENNEKRRGQQEQNEGLKRKEVHQELSDNSTNHGHPEQTDNSHTDLDPRNDIRIDLSEHWLIRAHKELNRNLQASGHSGVHLEENPYVQQNNNFGQSEYAQPYQQMSYPQQQSHPWPNSYSYLNGPLEERHHRLEHNGHLQPGLELPQNMLPYICPDQSSYPNQHRLLLEPQHHPDAFNYLQTPIDLRIGNDVTHKPFGDKLSEQRLEIIHPPSAPQISPRVRGVPEKMGGIVINEIIIEDGNSVQNGSSRKTPGMKGDIPGKIQGKLQKITSIPDICGKIPAVESPGTIYAIEGGKLRKIPSIPDIPGKIRELENDRTGRSSFSERSLPGKIFVKTDLPGKSPGIKTDLPGKSPGIKTDLPGKSPGIKTDLPGKSPGIKTEVPDKSTPIKNGIPGKLTTMTVSIPGTLATMTANSPVSVAAMKADSPVTIITMQNTSLERISGSDKGIHDIKNGLPDNVATVKAGILGKIDAMALDIASKMKMMDSVQRNKFSRIENAIPAHVSPRKDDIPGTITAMEPFTDSMKGGIPGKIPGIPDKIPAIPDKISSMKDGIPSKFPFTKDDIAGKIIPIQRDDTAKIRAKEHLGKLSGIPIVGRDIPGRFVSMKADTPGKLTTMERRFQNKSCGMNEDFPGKIAETAPEIPLSFGPRKDDFLANIPGTAPGIPGSDHPMKEDVLGKISTTGNATQDKCPDKVPFVDWNITGNIGAVSGKSVIEERGNPSKIVPIEVDNAANTPPMENEFPCRVITTAEGIPGIVYGIKTGIPHPVLGSKNDIPRENQAVEDAMPGKPGIHTDFSGKTPPIQVDLPGKVTEMEVTLSSKVLGIANGIMPKKSGRKNDRPVKIPGVEEGIPPADCIPPPPGALVPPGRSEALEDTVPPEGSGGKLKNAFGYTSNDNKNSPRSSYCLCPECGLDFPDSSTPQEHLKSHRWERIQRAVTSREQNKLSSDSQKQEPSSGHHLDQGHSSNVNQEQGHSSNVNQEQGHSSNVNQEQGHSSNVNQEQGHSSNHSQKRRPSNPSQEEGHSSNYNAEKGHSSNYNTEKGHSSNYNTEKGHSSNYNTEKGHSSNYNQAKGHSTNNSQKRRSSSQSQEPSYICSICSQSLDSQSKLNLHELNHTAKAPFSCPECGQAFLRKAKLDEHMYQHRGLERHKCPICQDRTFSSRHELKKHLKTHEKDGQEERKPRRESLDEPWRRTLEKEGHGGSKRQHGKGGSDGPKKDEREGGSRRRHSKGGSDGFKDEQEGQGGSKRHHGKGPEAKKVRTEEGGDMTKKMKGDSRTMRKSKKEEMAGPAPKRKKREGPRNKLDNEVPDSKKKSEEKESPNSKKKKEDNDGPDSKKKNDHKEGPGPKKKNEDKDGPEGGKSKAKMAAKRRRTNPEEAKKKDQNKRSNDHPKTDNHGPIPKLVIRLPEESVASTSRCPPSHPKACKSGTSGAPRTSATYSSVTSVGPSAAKKGGRKQMANGGPISYFCSPSTCPKTEGKANVKEGTVTSDLSHPLGRPAPVGVMERSLEGPPVLTKAEMKEEMAPGNGRPGSTPPVLTKAVIALGKAGVAGRCAGPTNSPPVLTKSTSNRVPLTQISDCPPVLAVSGVNPDARKTPVASTSGCGPSYPAKPGKKQNWESTPAKIAAKPEGKTAPDVGSGGSPSSEDDEEEDNLPDFI